MYWKERLWKFAVLHYGLHGFESYVITCPL